MDIANTPTDSANDKEDLRTKLIMQEVRLSKLEEAAPTTLIRRLTSSASTGALFLGLILTFATLYDTFISKPEADRVTRLSQFNQAVNSAAKTRQEAIQAQIQISDPALQLVIMSASTPRILNDIATAKALLRGMDEDDVGVPQLIILISESSTTGDLESAKSFVDLAVKKKKVTPMLRSEAFRYEGKFWFMSGDTVKGRKSFQSALNVLGDNPGGAMQKAFILADLVMLEFIYRSCDAAAEDSQTLLASLHLPQIPMQERSQLTATIKAQLAQMQGDGCPVPRDFSSLALRWQVT